MKCGDCVLMPKGGGNHIPHLWVVVTDPNAQGMCVIVNVTTLKHICDKTVVLCVGEHPFITHDSIVFYADAQIVLAGAIDNAIRGGVAQKKEDCPLPTLQRIQQGLLDSPHTSGKVIKFCEACWPTKAVPK
jgi:hypothetical protein